MITTIEVKDIGDVREKKFDCGEVVWGIEDGIEKWIKSDLRLDK